MTGARGTVETGTILDRIIATTAQTNDLKKSMIPVSGLARMAKRKPKAKSLRAALRSPDELSLIAEIKRASPSKGKFPVDFEVTDVAFSYLFAGANAISVLTDEPYFQGLLDDLLLTSEVASAWRPRTPVLRKDFIIDEYQLIESRAFGADATLLIVAALTDQSLVDLMGAARRIGIEVLVEVHDEVEMERALAAGAQLIGINNRDLHTFTVDLGVSERLAAMVPDDVVLVGESGISTEEDARRMRRAGMDAVLVGESLILAENRTAAIEQIMLEEPRGPADDATAQPAARRVCGLRQLEHAQIASDAGADLLGFVFAPSKRQVTAEIVRPIVDSLHGAAIPVGLFVEESSEQINTISRAAGITLIQVHWRTQEGDLLELELPYMLVRRTEPGATYESTAPALDRVLSSANPPRWILIDSYHPRMSGGSGELADWGLAARLAESFPIMLAGGLNPENVAAAIEQVHPLGVDVSSGVELEGQKSPTLIDAFVRNARHSFERYSSSSDKTVHS